MSFNLHSYTNLHEHCTFQNNTQPNFMIPPPPPLPQYLISSVHYKDDITDIEIAKSFEKKIAYGENFVKVCYKNTSIIELQQNLQNIVKLLAEIKEHKEFISQNIETLSESEWKGTMDKINDKKDIITIILSKITESKLTILKKVVTKRLAKRLRQKRLRPIQKHEKEIKQKALEERSRHIDENVQTFKDHLNKTQQQEIAKQQADVVLREVLRKKHDAKRWIVKLDALVKLRRARLNTARGQGINLSEKEAELFIKNIDNIKSLWVHKSSQYDKEEVELHSKLQQNQEKQDDNNEQLQRNLLEWKQFLFGDELPQADFNGDIQQFLYIRSHWDNYINIEGSPLPVGWVTPRITSSD